MIIGARAVSSLEEEVPNIEAVATPAHSAMITGKSSQPATRLLPAALTVGGAAAVAMAMALRPIL